MDLDGLVVKKFAHCIAYLPTNPECESAILDEFHGSHTNEVTKRDFGMLSISWNSRGHAVVRLTCFFWSTFETSGQIILVRQ